MVNCENNQMAIGVLLVSEPSCGTERSKPVKLLKIITCIIYIMHPRLVRD